MIINTDEIKHIYISAHYQDMRKQINGLTLLVTSTFNMNDIDHSLFIFTNRSRTQLKMLYYDYSGFWLINRKLQKGCFNITEHDGKQVIEIDKYQLSRLVEGMVFEPQFLSLKDAESMKKPTVYL